MTQAPRSRLARRSDLRVPLCRPLLSLRIPQDLAEEAPSPARLGRRLLASGSQPPTHLCGHVEERWQCLAIAPLVKALGIEVGAKLDGFELLLQLRADFLPGEPKPLVQPRLLQLLRFFSPLQAFVKRPRCRAPDLPLPSDRLRSVFLVRLEVLGGQGRGPRQRCGVERVPPPTEVEVAGPKRSVEPQLRLDRRLRRF